MELLNQRYQPKEILSDKGVLKTCRGFDTRDNREVILKFIDLNTLSDWKLWDLFEREIEIISKLHHPGLPRYIDHFQVETGADAGYYLVNSFVSGHTLEEMLSSGYRFSENEVIAVAVSILETLDYLHRNRPAVIHRDINPKNIVRADNGQFTLIDFGASKRIFEEKATGTTSVMGTYGYIPMEQMVGEALPQSDIYALGMTLIHLKTGVHPGKFPLKDLKPNYLGGKHREFIDEVIDRMIEPDVNKRSYSARKLADALSNPAEFRKKEALGNTEPHGSKAPVPMGNNIEIEFHNDSKILTYYNEKSKRKEHGPVRFILDAWINRPWLCIILLSVVTSGSAFLPLMILHLSGITNKWFRRLKANYSAVEIHRSRHDLRVPDQFSRIPLKAVKKVEHYAKRTNTGYQTEYVLTLRTGEKKSFFMSDMTRDDIDTVSGFLDES